MTCCLTCLHAQVQLQHQQREEEMQATRQAAAHRSELIKQRRLELEAVREAEQLHILQAIVRLQTPVT